MKKNIVKNLLVLVCLVGLTANAEELTQTNTNEGVRINVTAGASALTTWQNATDTDSFLYGGQLGLSFENVLVKNLEVGVRQSLTSVDRYNTESTTITTQSGGGGGGVVTTTTTTTTPNPKTPKGNAWGWYKNHSATVTTTTTTTTSVPGNPSTYSSQTSTTVEKTSEWVGSTELFADYNLSLCKAATLFGGVNASVYYGEGLSPLWYAGPEAGLKVNLSKDVYLYGRVNYDFQLDERKNSDNDQFRYGVGIGVRF